MNHGIDQIKQNDESALIETSDRNQSLPHVKSERSSNKTTAKAIMIVKIHLFMLISKVQ